MNSGKVFRSSRRVMEIVGLMGQMLDCGAMLNSQRKRRRHAKSEGLFKYHYCLSMVYPNYCAVAGVIQIALTNLCNCLDKLYAKIVSVVF